MIGTLVLTGGSLYAGVKLYNSMVSERISHLREIWPLKKSGGQTQAVSKVDNEPKANVIRKQEEPPPHNQNLLLSSFSLGAATSARLFYAPLLSAATIPALLYLGLPSAKEAIHSLKEEGRASMALLDTVVLVACLVEGYYIASSLIFCLDYLSQRVLSSRVDKNQNTLFHLIGRPENASWLIANSLAVEQPEQQIKSGERLVIPVGELIPIDGVITDGYALLDCHYLTANSEPLPKKVGDEVLAGSIVLAGEICVQVKEVGNSTHVAQIASHLRHITDETRRSSEQDFSQQAFLPLLLGSALASFVIAPMGAVAILATRLGSERVAPFAKVTALEEALQEGILIRDGKVLERLRQVNYIVIDHDVALQAPELLEQLQEYDFQTISVASAEDKKRAIEERHAERKSICYITSQKVEKMQTGVSLSISVAGISEMMNNNADILLLDGSPKQLGRLFDWIRILNERQQNTFRLSLLPAALTISAPFLWHTGLMATIMLNQVGWLMALGYLDSRLVAGGEVG